MGHMKWMKDKTQDQARKSSSKEMFSGRGSTSESDRDGASRNASKETGISGIADIEWYGVNMNFTLVDVVFMEISETRKRNTPLPPPFPSPPTNSFNILHNFFLILAPWLTANWSLLHGKFQFQGGISLNSHHQSRNDFPAPCPVWKVRRKSHDGPCLGQVGTYMISYNWSELVVTWLAQFGLDTCLLACHL